MYLNGQQRLTLAVNAVNSTIYIKKGFKQKLFQIKFPTKTQWTSVSISPPPRVKLGASKIAVFEMLWCTEIQKKIIILKKKPRLRYRYVNL